MSFRCSYGLIIETIYSSRIISIVFCTTIAIPTTLLNALVLIAVWKTPDLHKPSQILLANLALTDLLVGAFTCPFMAFGSLAIVREWYNLVCDSWIVLGGLAYFLAGMNLYTMAIISIDRFLAIKLKFNYGTGVTKRRLFTVLLGGWLVFCSLYALHIIYYKSIQWNAFLILIAVYVAIILCTTTIFYCMAFYYLKKLSTQVSSNNANNLAADVTWNFGVNKYRRSLHTMVIMVFVIFIFYLPYILFTILSNALEEFTITGHLLRITELLVLCNSCVNPMLYLWRMKDLRQAVQTTLRKCC